jgi:hypothetical protein
MTNGLSRSNFGPLCGNFDEWSDTFYVAACHQFFCDAEMAGIATEWQGSQ